MGSPIVRQEDLTRVEKKLNDKINRTKRELRAEFIEYLESLGLTGPAAEDLADAAADPEAVALVEGINERKAEADAAAEAPAAAEGADGALFGEES